MGQTGVHHVTVTVTDLDRTATWYRDVLGFEKISGMRQPEAHSTSTHWASVISR